MQQMLEKGQGRMLKVNKGVEKSKIPGEVDNKNTAKRTAAREDI